MKLKGARWISSQRRFKIYDRDNWQCQYCGFSPQFNIETIVFGNLLSLDHVQTRKDGGKHSPENLITACMSCNNTRRARTVRDFVKDQFPQSWEKILIRIKNARRRKLK